MTAIELAKALLVGITDDRFTRALPNGWMYDVEYNPPIPDLGFGIGYDLCLTVVSPHCEVTEVFVCKPRPLAPVPCMFAKTFGGGSVDGDAFSPTLLEVLEDIAKDEVEATLMETIAAGGVESELGTPGDWAALEPACA